MKPKLPKISWKDKKMIVQTAGRVGEMDAIIKLLRGKRILTSSAQLAVSHVARKKPELVLKGGQMAQEAMMNYIQTMKKKREE